MQILSQASLLPFNTFGIETSAEQLVILDQPDDLIQVGEKIHEALIIGGGSNILLSKPSYPFVLINRISGIEVVENKEDEITISVGSGENWHELVKWALAHHYGGLENLSLIPGTVGAAPIQNIGAYGVELKDVLVGVDYVLHGTPKAEFIPVQECQLQYRDSIFKNQWKNKGFITKVYLRLSKNSHIIHVNYNALRHFLSEKQWYEPTIHQISEAVIQIRKSKLPDWHEVGNAGSFFKNPVVPKSLFLSLEAKHPTLPSFAVDEEQIKIPAAWLIQESGFKGFRRGNVGTYPFQPLVLVNYGGGTANEILQLKEDIQEEVLHRFGIQLVPEVTIL